MDKRTGFWIGTGILATVLVGVLAAVFLLPRLLPKKAGKPYEI